MKKIYFNKFIKILDDIDKEKMEKLYGEKKPCLINYSEELIKITPLFKKECEENISSITSPEDDRKCYKMYCGILFFD